MYPEMIQLLWSKECRSFVIEIKEVVTIGISRFVRKRVVQNLEHVRFKF
jgi:hypothetical protein